MFNIEDNLNFDQMIWEFGDDNNPPGFMSVLIH